MTRSSLWWFAVRLVVGYGLLVAPWPGLQATYGRIFRAASNQMLAWVGLGRTVELAAPEVEHREWDVEMRMRHPSQAGSWHMEYSSRAWGYLPTAAIIALILATPIPWSRRWRTLAWTVAIIHVFIALRIGIAVWYGLYWGQAIALTPFWADVAELALVAVSGSPVATYLVPVVIWMFVACGWWLAGPRGGHKVLADLRHTG